MSSSLTLICVLFAIIDVDYCTIFQIDLHPLFFLAITFCALIHVNLLIIFILTILSKNKTNSISESNENYKRERFKFS